MIWGNVKKLNYSLISCRKYRVTISLELETGGEISIIQISFDRYFITQESKFVRVFLEYTNLAMPVS